MRTRYLNIDYFTATPIQTLETLTFLHLPIPDLDPSNPSAVDVFHFDSVHLKLSLQIEQLPIEAALSKFFSDVLPQSIVLDVGDFEVADSSPDCRNFGFGGHELRFSEKDNGRRDGEKDAVQYKVLQFETPELDVFLENAYIHEKEEFPILSEVPEAENNLETLNLPMEYPWEIHESVHTVDDFHSEYPMDQKAYMLEDDGSYKDQMHVYQTFPLLEANEMNLQTLTSFSVEDELCSIYENIESQHWSQQDNLCGNELLGTKEYEILERLSDHCLSKQCLGSDLGSFDFTPEMDLVSILEVSQIEGNTTYQGTSKCVYFPYLSPVVFQEFQILDFDSSQNFEVVFSAQAAIEPDICDSMFNRDMNFDTLIVSHELALVDDTFKSLPVPVLSDQEKISSSYVVIEGTLTDLQPQPLSASDRIYLDWHLLEKDNCNCQVSSSHQRMLEDTNSISPCFDWDSNDDGKLVYDFVFSGDDVDGLNTEENQEELLSDDIRMRAGLFGDASANLSRDNSPQPKNGEHAAKRCAERASSCFKSMSQFNDIDFFLNPQKASTGGKSNCAALAVDNIATFTKGKQPHSVSGPVEDFNDQKSEDLLDIFPSQENNYLRSKVGADNIEASSMALPNTSRPSAIEAEGTESMASFPEMVIIVNTKNLEKEMIVSRRSTYQKILALEKEGAQVVERDSDLPVDIIISSAVCLVWYDCSNIGKKATALDEASSCLPMCIENIATNVLTLLSFTFSGCIMVFEGENSFLSTVMEFSDGLYAAAASLGIDLQLFNSYSSELTDEIILSCMGYATKSTRRIYPQMPESESLAESFLTKFPSVNALTAHAILSSGGLLKEFLEWSHKTRIYAIQKYHVPVESMTLFSASCKYGEKDDSKSTLTDCSSSVSSGPDSGKFSLNIVSERRKRKYNGSPEKYEIHMDDLLNLGPSNQLNDSILHPSTVSRMSERCEIIDQFRNSKFSQNDLFDQEQGFNVDMMMNPFRVSHPCDSQISKGPQVLNEIKSSCLSFRDKLSGQKQRSDTSTMEDFDWNDIKNFEVLNADLKGEVIDLTNSPVLDEDFPSIANSLRFSSFRPELETDSTRKSKAARKLSFGPSSHRTFPTAAEIESSSTLWPSVKDPRKSSQVGANNYSDAGLENNVFPLRNRNKPLEDSFMQRHGGNSQGLHLHDNDISHYGGTPLSKALRSGSPQQNTPWTIEFLNRIKEKSRLRQQSLPDDLSAPSLGYSGNISKVTKRRSPSILEFFKYQGGNTPRKLPETKRQKRPLQSSSSSKKEKGSATLPTGWTPLDKRARQTLSFAMNESGSQTKLVWSDGPRGLRRKFQM